MRFYAHGKLMLTGEYLVLRGAGALAIPTKFGQHLEVTVHTQPEYLWRAIDAYGQLWLKVDFDASWNILDSNDGDKAVLLQRIFRQAQKIKGTPVPFCRATTQLEFERAWGLGTSSSLIVLIAKWFQIDAFELFKNTLTGSGYDIAAAQSDKAVLYNMLPQMHFSQVKLPEVFQDSFFLYLGQKQNSEKEVIAFKDRVITDSQISEINHITSQLQQVKELKEVEDLIHQHELLLSAILEREPVKKVFFADYPGAIKSLGAWGGDFIWATRKTYKDYFIKKGYQTIFDWNDMIL